MKTEKYIVVLTVDTEPGIFNIYVSTIQGKEKAGEMAINKLKNEYPIYRNNKVNIYNINVA